MSNIREENQGGQAGEVLSIPGANSVLPSPSSTVQKTMVKWDLATSSGALEAL